MVAAAAAAAAETFSGKLKRMLSGAGRKPGGSNRIVPSASMDDELTGDAGVGSFEDNIGPSALGRRAGIEASFLGLRSEQSATSVMQQRLALQLTWHQLALLERHRNLLMHLRCERMSGVNA